MILTPDRNGLYCIYQLQDGTFVDWTNLAVLAALLDTKHNGVLACDATNRRNYSVEDFQPVIAKFIVKPKPAFKALKELENEIKIIARKR